MTVIKVGPNQGAGYTTLQDAIDSEETAGTYTDCITNTDIVIFEVYDFQDTTAVTINSSFWQTNDSYYIHIRPGVDGTDGDGSHDGRSRDVTGSGYQLSISGSNALTLSGQTVLIEGIDIKTAGTTGTYRCVHFPGTMNKLTLKDCIIHDSLSSAGTNYQVSSNATSSTIVMENCIVYGNGRNIDVRSATSADVDHCTFYGGADYGVLGDGNSNFYNCYSGGHTNEDWWTGGAAPSGDYNGSADSSATTDYANGTISLTASSQFNNASLGSSADFLLKSGSGCEGAGGSGSSVSVDILGNARDGSTPDLGASEYVTAASGNPHYYYAQQ